MNADDRFDDVLRAALEWQADEDARSAPTLEKSVRVLADRLGPEPSRRAPLVTLRPGSVRSLQLIVLVGILVALVVAALTIGSQLLRQAPEQLGLGADCAVSLRDGVVMEVTVADQHATLYASGLFVTDRSRADGTQASIVEGARFGERRLTSRGQQLVVERIGGAGLAEGCRTWRTQEASGSIRAVTPQGRVQANWGPGAGEFSFARVATLEDEARIDDLARSLARPDTWLPADAWIDAAERELAPDRWVVLIGFIDTELPPGSRIQLANGLELNGTDPRYERVVVPGGVSADEFGVEFPSPYSASPRSSVRCDVIGRDDALAMARSVDALGFDTAAGDSLHNSDLTAEVSFEFEPAIPEGYDCEAALARRTGGTESTQETAPPAAPDGELASIDPCSLASDAVMAVLDATRRRVEPSRLPIGLPASACSLSGDATFGARIVIYPRAVDGEAARELALAVFGDGAVEESRLGGLVWLNKCFAERLDCAGAVAVVSEPYLVLIDFDGGFGDSKPDEDTARAMVAAVLKALPE